MTPDLSNVYDVGREKEKEKHEDNIRNEHDKKIKIKYDGAE